MWNQLRRSWFGTAIVLSLSTLTRADAGPEPTLVLVHGALFADSSWQELTQALAREALPYAAVNLPGRSSDDDPADPITLISATAKVCQALQKIEGPVILVGHSQGGAVITQAVGQCGRPIAALVYVAAVLPLGKEIAFAGLTAQDRGFGLITKPNPDTQRFEIQPQALVSEFFFQDAPAALAATALRKMVNEPIGIGTTPAAIDNEKVAAVPKYYLETTHDRILSLETQRNAWGRLTMKGVFPFATGHCPQLTQPAKVAARLKQIAQGGTMDTDAKAVATQYFAALTSGQFEKLGALFADDIIWRQPGKGKLSGVYRGKKAVFELFGRFMEISQKTFRIDRVHSILANGDWVSAPLHFSAQKPGAEISMEGVDTMRIEGGQIQEMILFSADPPAEDAFWN